MKKNIRKLFLLMAVVTTALVCFAVSASALDATGQCGDNVYWDYNSTTGKLIISGTGPMTDYENYYSSPFYDSNIKSVVINDSVTTIGAYAFCECNSLTEVTIGDSVTTIGDYAFYWCESLTEVTIPDSVTTIGNWAFSSCNSLTEVTIGNSVTTIGDGAFYGCDSLTEVNIGDSVTTIGNRAFEYCESLTEVTIPDSVTTIGDDAFYWCYSLTEITIPDSVTTIGDYAFYWCYSLTEVTIPDSVTTIGNWAFSSCNSLTEVIIGNSVTTIGDYAFCSCNSLTEVTIGDSVTTIGDYAFQGCDSLTEVTIGDGVTTIGDKAFYWCESLTDVYYGGTQAQWKKIKFGSDNGDLTSANIHYTCYHINKTTHAQQNPTCTAKGYTAGIYCPDCEEWIEGHKEISKIPHSYTKYTSDKNATLLADGTKTALCDYGCGNKKTVTDEGSKLTLGEPSNLKATQTTSSITLTWSEAENATGYRLYYKLPGDISWRNAVTYTVATEHTFENLPAGQKYRFAVQSAYKKADGSYIRGGYKEIETATKAAKPSNVSATQNTSSIKLTWSAVNGADGYKIFYKVNGKWKACATVATTSRTFNNLKAGAKYTFAIQPYSVVDGKTIYGEYAEYTTATKPATVTAKVTSPSKGKISLSWNQVNGSEGYQIWYSKNGGSYKLYKTVGASAKSMSFSNLASGTKYTFAVRAGIKTTGGNIFGAYKEAAITVK